VRKLLRSLDGEACCLGGLGSARVVGLRAAKRKPIAAGLHGANAVRIHLGELSRIQPEDNVPDLSRREVEALKAFQLQVRREAAVAVVGRHEIEFRDLIAGFAARVPHISLCNQHIAGVKCPGRELQVRVTEFRVAETIAEAV